MIEELSARLLEARNFRPQLHLPLALGRVQLGWLRRDHAERLRDWPDLFQFSDEAVRIRAKSENDLTTAFAEVAAKLARDGAVQGWRGETYAVRPSGGAVASFHVERAAFRFFGFTSSASHLNGFQGERIFIARRAKTKSIDPGMLDTLVGGGVPSGQDAWQTLLRECGEEAGIAPGLAAQARFCGTLLVCRAVAEGVHSEILFVHDLELPADFAPRNTDGEVSEFLALDAQPLLERIGRGEMTIEAGLVAADFVERRGLARVDARSRELLERCRGSRY